MSAFTQMKSIAMVATMILAGACGSPQQSEGREVHVAPPFGTCDAGSSFDRSRAVRPGECAAGDILVQGTITRRIGERFAYDGPLALGEDSAARVTLLGSHGDVQGDATAETIADQIIAPIRALPFSYCVSGSMARAASFRQVIILVEVRQHADRYTVGDLNHEVFHELTPPVQGESLEVTGMESCSAPNAGGFCLCD